MIAQHSRGTQHAHLLRLEAPDRWAIVGTAPDGAAIVDWWLDNRPADLAGVYRTVACSRVTCAPGALN